MSSPGDGWGIGFPALCCFLAATALSSSNRL